MWRTDVGRTLRCLERFDSKYTLVPPVPHLDQDTPIAYI